MPDLESFLAPLRMHDWYALALVVLSFAINLVKNPPSIPVVRWLFAKAKAVWLATPDGFKWVWPVLGGFFTGVLAGLQAGLAVGDVLKSGLGGALAIGFGAMGFNAFMTESPLPWDGGTGAGGKKAPTKTILLAAMLALAAFGCAPGKPAEVPPPPSSLPEGDPCRLDLITVYAEDCGAACDRDNPPDSDGLEACRAKCDAEIKERCKR